MSLNEVCRGHPYVFKFIFSFHSLVQKLHNERNVVDSPYAEGLIRSPLFAMILRHHAAQRLRFRPNLILLDYLKRH